MASHIVFVLTAKQKKELKKNKLLRNRAGVYVRVKYSNGKLYVTHHKKGGRFVASNAAFA